jgi:hypothetical protein
MAKNACQHFCKKKKATQKGKTQQGHWSDKKPNYPRINEAQDQEILWAANTSSDSSPLSLRYRQSTHGLRISGVKHYRHIITFFKSEANKDGLCDAGFGTKPLAWKLTISHGLG